jgi:hypothetical protein
MFPAVKGVSRSAYALRSAIEPGQPLMDFRNPGAGYSAEAHRRATQLRTISPATRRLMAIRNSISIPGSKFDYSQVTSLRIQLRQTLQDAVGRVMGQTTIIRDLAAYDISGVAAGTALFARLNNKNATVARTWLVNDLGFRVVPVNTAVGIYGFVQMASIPLLDGIAFTQGGVLTLAQFWLHHIYADQFSSIGYFDPPIVWKPQQSVGINLLSETLIGAAAESYGLLGYIAEPAANTVAPDQANLV